MMPTNHDLRVRRCASDLAHKRRSLGLAVDLTSRLLGACLKHEGSPDPVFV